MSPLPAPLRLAEAYLALARGDRGRGAACHRGPGGGTPDLDRGRRSRRRPRRDGWAIGGRPRALSRPPPSRPVGPAFPGTRRGASRRRRGSEEAGGGGGPPVRETSTPRGGPRTPCSSSSPTSSAGYVLLSRAAAAGGKNEDAWTWAKEARKRAPADRVIAAFAADAAGEDRPVGRRREPLRRAHGGRSVVRAEGRGRPVRVQGPEPARGGAPRGGVVRA